MTAGQQASGKKKLSGSHLVYGSNLIGSALGALITLPVLSLVGGEGAVFVAATLGSAAGLLFSFYDRKQGKEDFGTTVSLGASGGVREGATA